MVLKTEMRVTEVMLTLPTQVVNPEHQHPLAQPLKPIVSRGFSEYAAALHNTIWASYKGHFWFKNTPSSFMRTLHLGSSV